MLDQYSWETMWENVAVETRGVFERSGTGGKPIEDSSDFPRDFAKFQVVPSAVPGVTTFVFAQDPACKMYKVAR